MIRFVSRIYAQHWSIIPNLGTDLLLPPLMHILPVHVAGRIVIGLAVLLPVIGTIAYSNATFGTRSAWPLASGLVAYNGDAASRLPQFPGHCRDRAAARRRLDRLARPLSARAVALLAGIGTVALFFCHLMGLVFFYVLIAGYELERLWLHRTQPEPSWRGSPRCCLSSCRRWRFTCCRRWHRSPAGSNSHRPTTNCAN